MRPLVDIPHAGEMNLHRDAFPVVRPSQEQKQRRLEDLGLCLAYGLSPHRLRIDRIHIFLRRRPEHHVVEAVVAGRAAVRLEIPQPLIERAAELRRRSDLRSARHLSKAFNIRPPPRLPDLQRRVRAEGRPYNRLKCLVRRDLLVPDKVVCGIIRRADERHVRLADKASRAHVRVALKLLAALVPDLPRSVPV